MFGTLGAQAGQHHNASSPGTHPSIGARLATMGPMDLDSMPEGGYCHDLVRLRPKTLDDVDPGYDLIRQHGAMLDGHDQQGDSDITREELVQLWHPWRQRHPMGFQYQLAIEELDAQAFRGSLLIRCAGEGHPAEVGYWVDPDHWGRGLGRQAVRLAQWWAFSHLNAAAFTARVQADNPRSRRLLESLGLEDLGPLYGQGGKLLAYHQPRFRWPDRDGPWCPQAG